MKEIAELHWLIDQMVVQLSNSTAAAGKPVTCPGKGCFACCYEPVYCSREEVRHIIEMLTVEQIAEVTEKTRVAVEKIKASGLFNVRLPPVTHWTKQLVACPFLKDGNCSVYERRPVGCRVHMAVGKPELCSCDRMNQKYPKSLEFDMAMGHMILASHMRIGNSLTHDNMLAFLAEELLGEKLETASRETINMEKDNYDG